MLYYATHFIFNESLFPRCKAPERQPNTKVHDSAPVNHHHQHHSDDVDDEETTPPLHVPARQQLPVPTAAPPQQEVPPPRTPPVQQEPQPAPPPVPRPQRVRKVLVRPGNIYGETCHPVDILKGAGKKKGGHQAKGAVPRTAENNPLPDVPVPGPSTPARQESIPLPPISPAPSELEIECGLDGPEADVLCHDGGGPLLSFLLVCTISPIDAAAVTDPKTWVYKDVVCLPPAEQQEWQDACSQELEALRKCEVFELVLRPKYRKVIKNWRVFDVKPDGYKSARLVVKRFSQVEGLDYNQIFSPVVCFETVCLILSMAALKNWTISGLNIQNTFLYGDLDEEIYMEQPEGFCVQDQEHDVLRLKHALYGLKQVGLAWWCTLRESMIELGFEGLVSDAGLFIFRNEHGFIIAVIYVEI